MPRSDKLCPCVPAEPASAVAEPEPAVAAKVSAEVGWSFVVVLLLPPVPL